MQPTIYLSLSCLFVVLMGCQSSGSNATPKENQYKANDPNRPLVDSQYKLSADREKFNQMRGEIPTEKQSENDELAFTLQLLNGDNLTKRPEKLREQFDSALRKKREKIQKDLTREREDFTKKERKDREAFLKSQADARVEFNRNKHGKEEREPFFTDLDEKRRNYFATEREKRNDFESDINERRKNFEDYAREKNNEMNEEYRAYVRRFHDAEQEKKKAKEKAEATANPNASANSVDTPVVSPPPVSEKPKSGSSQKDFEEFNSIPKTGGTPLESGQ